MNSSELELHKFCIGPLSLVILWFFFHPMQIVLTTYLTWNEFRAFNSLHVLVVRLVRPKIEKNFKNFIQFYKFFFQKWLADLILLHFACPEPCGKNYINDQYENYV